jgi:hypothetical protein
MAHQTLEQRREYDRKYRIANAEKLRAYQIARNEKRRKTKPFQIQLHPDTDKVLKSLPNPFGSFEKAKYVCRIRGTKISFITTCRNTEDCIELMKIRFKEINNYALRPVTYCIIYKIQNGIRKMIFNEAI